MTNTHRQITIQLGRDEWLITMLNENNDINPIVQEEETTQILTKKEELTSLLHSINASNSHAMRILKQYFVEQVLEACSDKHTAVSYLQEIFDAAGVSEQPFAIATLYFIPAEFEESINPPASDARQVLMQNIFKNEDFMTALNTIGELYEKLILITDDDEFTQFEQQIFAIQGTFSDIDQRYPNSNAGFNAQKIEEGILRRLTELCFTTLRTNPVYRQLFIESVDKSGIHSTFIATWLQSEQTQENGSLQAVVYKELSETLLDAQNSSLLQLEDIIMAHASLQIAQHERRQADMSLTTSNEPDTKEPRIPTLRQ